MISSGREPSMPDCIWSSKHGDGDVLGEGNILGSVGAAFSIDTVGRCKLKPKGLVALVPLQIRVCMYVRPTSKF